MEAANSFALIYFPVYFPDRTLKLTLDFFIRNVNGVGVDVIRKIPKMNQERQNIIFTMERRQVVGKIVPCNFNDGFQPSRDSLTIHSSSSFLRRISFASWSWQRVRTRLWPG